MQKDCQLFVKPFCSLGQFRVISINSVLCVAGSHPAGVPYANITCCVHTHWFYLISSAPFVTSLKCIEL